MEFEAAWDIFKAAMDDVYQSQLNKINRQRYMKVYSATYNFCSCHCGSKMYESINEYLISHCEAEMKKLDEQTGKTLLELYLKIWKEYKSASKVLNALAVYLNRHYIPRKICEGNHNVYYIMELALRTWKNVLLKSHYKRIEETAKKTDTECGDKNEEDNSLNKEVMLSLKEIDFCVNVGNSDFNTVNPFLSV